jgi:hypothetical protein
MAVFDARLRTVGAISRIIGNLAPRFPLRAPDLRAPRARLLTETAGAREQADASTVPTAGADRDR